jgi:hypothetical protein
VVIAAVIVCLGLAPIASGARQPTLRERETLTRALPISVRNIPVGCVWLYMRVAKNGRYAYVKPAFLNATRAPCVSYAFDGFFVLRKGPTRWKVIYKGSDPPPCSLGVPRDFVACLR